MRIAGRLIVTCVLGLAGWAAPPPQRPPTTAQALDELAATERQFAAAAREDGWRTAFLRYFADNAIALTPEPAPARDRLKSRPTRPFAEEELTWEPKAGDIAASGEMGWLTGPSTFIDHTAPQPQPGYGNYLSLWKKQPDGRWRVFIDLGTNVPEPVSFPTWFTHVTAVPRYLDRSRTGAARATASLLAADRRLDEALLTTDGATVYVSLIVEHARLHRAQTMPAISVGREQITKWFAGNPGVWTATPTTGEAAASGELGYVYGTYDFAGSTRQSGAYLRIWSRAGNGEWRIAADVTAPSGR